eukprot:TRINITY_DN25082_c0_g1_i2.p1 TRINITY_DN25082_c0_g1~~TRINITY_DN25082_c0_g1_i2.p1  ORF type:complete len:229 (+),score=40.40 TRINITY_DN25082_c0_g1_i2:112-798(+)
MKKVRPNDGCLCFSSRCLVLSTGCFSAVLSLLVILPCVFVLVSSQAWNLGRQAVKQWLQENHGDKKVNDAIGTCFDWVDRNYQAVLAGIIITAVVHLLFSLLLVLGTMLYKRLLFIPWMVTDMILIIFMVFLFTCWTFLSFFVGLLVAIIFPFVSGLLLGLWICIWRQVKFTFIVLGETDRDLLILRKQQAEYKPVPVQGAEQYNGRRQLASISESSDQGQQYKHYDV